MSMLFSESYYLNNNPDVLQAVLSGAFPNGQAHYNQHGWAEGRDPNANFDTSYYLQNNPDVFQAMLSGAFSSPLAHFLAHGAAEGRAPNAETAPLVAAFDADAYLAANPDVAAAIPGAFDNAMEHWLLHGQFEGRPGVPFIGQDFTLTTAVDTFTGGEGNDTFNAQLGVGIDGLAAVQTLQGADVLNGGGGFNELNAELNGTGTTQNPTISNIQVYNLTALTGLLGADAELDLGRATGYEQLWNRNSREDLTLWDVGEVAILGMDNVRDGSTYEVNYDNIAVETQVVVANQSGAAGNRVELEINGVLGGDITTLDLVVSNGVYLRLDNDAADMDNLIISGSGILDLVGEDEFEFLQTLDSTMYDGDLDLDVSGSDILTSVMTGPGDDRVVVSNAAVDGDLEVDMGAGANTLAITGVVEPVDFDDLDFTGGVVNVQTLEFVDGFGWFGAFANETPVLDLDGLADLTTINFEGSIDIAHDSGNTLQIDTAPTDLAINFNGGSIFTGLDINGTENLSIGGTDVTFIGSASSLQGADLVNVDADVSGDLTLNMSDNLDNLETLAGTAGEDASVNLNSDGTQLGALRTVNVTGANATLNMTGAAGIAFVAGVNQTQTFAINVTGAGGFPNSTSAGNVAFTSGDVLPGGVQSFAYATGPFLFGSNADPRHDWGAADDMAAGISGITGLSATSGAASNQFTVVWDEFGSFDPLAYQAGLSGGTTGSLDSVVQTGFTAGSDQIEMEEGEGFESVETINVDAVDGDANVNLTDVYGSFVLEVTATEDANVNLTNTNVTLATVSAGETANVFVGGDTIGAWSLEVLTVVADEANVTLEGNMEDFTALNVADVTTSLTVDTSGAEFSVGAGQYITYLIGATSDNDDSTVDVDFTGNAIREVYEFVGGDIGEVVITAFTSGADPMTGDRLDLSQLGVNSSGELIFTNDGGDLVITSLGDQDFTGSITLVGLAGDGADVSSFNIIYA